MYKFYRSRKCWIGMIYQLSSALYDIDKTAVIGPQKEVSALKFYITNSRVSRCKPRTARSYNSLKGCNSVYL